MKLHTHTHTRSSISAAQRKWSTALRCVVASGFAASPYEDLQGELCQCAQG